jgi:hypothetical protein
MRRLLPILLLLALSLPAYAQSNVLMNYKASTTDSGTQVSPTNPMPIGGGFIQIARAADFSVTNTTANEALGTVANTARVCNIGSNTGYVAFGGSSVTVTAANGFPIIAGTCANLSAVGYTYIAAITASSTTTLQISLGSGIAALDSGGGGNTPGSNGVFNTVAIGGDTIGSNALAVTGTANFSSTINVNGIQLGSNGDVFQIYNPSNNIGIISLGANNTTNQIQLGGATGTFLTYIASTPGILQFGTTDAAVPVAQTLRVQSVVAGTAAANGANWTLIGSLPTGTGTSGDIIFQTGVKTGSGTTQGTATTALTLKGETQLVYTNSATQILGSETTITGGGTSNVPTLTSGPVTGNPTKWMPYDDNGTTRYIPAW